MADSLQDIARAVHGLKAAFERYGLEPPKRITLESAEQGRILSAQFRHSPSRPFAEENVEPRAAAEPTTTIITLAGIEIAWPSSTA